GICAAGLLLNLLARPDQLQSAPQNGSFMKVQSVLRRLAWRGALIGMVCGLTAWLLARQPIARVLEGWALDSCFVYRGTRATQTKVVLIGLDDFSLDELGKPLACASPELAEVVSFLRRRGAAAIGLDLMVPESLESFADLRAESLG